MSPIISKNPLVLKIVEGGANNELLEYLLQKKLAFTEEEYLESLVFVLPHATFHEQALSMLELIPWSVKENYVQKKEAHPHVAEFILQEALQTDHFNALAMIIQNQHLPNEFLLRIAAQGKANTLEILLENQVRLIAYPEILEKMELNPECGQFILGKIKELREFYFQSQVLEAIPEQEILNDLAKISVPEQASEKELSLDEIQQRTLTALQRINRMSISQRIRLALTGDKTERLILIKDSNRMVQLAVIESPKMADDEVLIHTRNLSLSGELIAKIANNREWTKNYTIILALVQNPKTPIHRAISFIKQLHTRDLKLLIQDRNINPVIRNLATNLQKEKERVKG
ncbi:MAG: hypothetical protein JXI33_07310 [Candidatus Aminicenantes bacterium]|nr:hypothetical protein [Candidatus Aminicenantes bacterium]